MAIKEINRLQKLDSNKQITFAYLTCERLFPNYVYFSINYNYGNPDVLRRSIEYIGTNLFQDLTCKNEIQTFIKKVEKNTPEPGEFNTVLASSALDSCTAIMETLDFLIDKEFKRIIDVSTFAIETIVMYLIDSLGLDINLDRNFMDKINKCPLMTKELNIQLGIISFLENTKKLDVEDLRTLLHLQENNGNGSLDL